MGWKDVEFSGSDSAERVRRLQAFCADTSNADGFDGLLIVGGVDSYHSQLSQAVLKYLFLGSSGQELLGTQVISQEHDRLEDVVLLLTRRRISIFYSSESDAAVTILPMISQWHNVTEYTIHDAMEPDEQEARKVRAFKRMVASVPRVGIPYGVDASGRDLDDSMVPEKWPLVQAYGLDDDDDQNGTVPRKKGFFTMHHAVVNVSCRLRDELAKLDDFAAKRVAMEVPPLLTHHFDQFLLKLDHAESPAVRSAKSESELGEDLLSLYEFGTTQYDARGLTSAAHRGSRVLYGVRTAQAATTPSSSSAFLHNSGGSGPATHMLVQSEDPFSGVRFTRTYFLATGKTAPRVVDDDALVHPQDGGEMASKQREDVAAAATQSVDTRRLIELYVVLLRGFRCAVRAFVQAAAASASSQRPLSQCLAAAKTAALNEIKAALRGRFAKLPDDFVDTHVVVDAEALDACGRGGARFPGQKWNLVFLSCTLAHVPSQLATASDSSLGSLVVGDTLLFLTSSASRTATSSAPLCLNTTEPFPYFRSWIQPGREFDSVKAQLAALQSSFMLQSPALRLGQPMAPLDASLDDASSSSNATADPASSIAPATATPSVTSVGLSRAVLLLECDELPQLHGSMQLFTGGFCFKTPHVIPIMVSFAKHVASFRILSTPYEELVLLQLELKVTDSDDDTDNDGNGHTAISRALPFPITTRTIAFPLLAGTRFQEEIVHALSVWKTSAERLGLPFYRPHDLTLQFDGATPRDDSKNSETLSPLLAKSCASLVLRKPAASSASTDSAATIDRLFPRWFIPKDSNPTTTLPKPRKHDRAKTVVPLTIVLGLPGSSASAIARTICDVSSATSDWERVDIDCRDVPAAKNAVDQSAFAAEQIQARVGAALERILDAAAFELPPRLLLCVVGYVDAVSIAAAVKRGSSHWRLPTKIASLVSCVSATNAYVPDVNDAQCPLPRLFDQLASGFATHVVVTHTSDVPASALGRLRYHIDQTNPFADIYVLSSDVFEGSLAPLLCVDRFESAYYKRYRDAQLCDWETAAALAETDPAVAPQSVRFEIAPGIEKHRFLQSVGKTLAPFAALTKSMDKIHPVELMARQQQPPQSKASGSSGIRLAQSLAADKVLTQQRQQQQQHHHDLAIYGECWSVEALVSFAGDLDTVYEYVSTGTYARMRVLNQQACKTASMEIKITGRHLQPTKIQELVLGCYVNLDGAVRPLKNKITLTLEEKREIQKLHIMDDLPEGFYYDGVTYIDQFGGRHEFHPRMSEFIDEHLRSQNEKTTQHNAHVEENRKSQPTYVRQLL